MSDVSVLLVDDSEVFMDACRRVVDATDGFAVVGTAASGEEAVERATELRPGLVLMDIRMPGIGGFAAAERIHELVPETTLVMITADAGAPANHRNGVAFAIVNKRNLTPDALQTIWRRCSEKT
jgi:DNA-binding NarL/FixJ family response regulator